MRRVARPSEAAGPEQGPRRRGNFERHRDAVTPAHGRMVHGETHRRACVGDGAERMPERRRPSRAGRRRHKQRGAECRRAHAHHEGRARAPRQQPPHSRPRARHHRGCSGVGQLEELRARSRARRRREHSHHTARTSTGRGLDQPSHGGRGGGTPRPAHQPHRRRGDPRDQEPRAHNRCDAGRERQPRRCDGERDARAREQHGPGAGARVRPTEPPQPHRRVGHGVALTAYVNRLTPIRSAASCSSGGSWWTSGSSHPSPRSV